MRNKVLPEIQDDKALSFEYVSNLLEQIDQKMDEEIGYKQQTITRQENEIQKLRTIIEEKNSTIRDTADKLLECQRSSEGNRQLINKLLADIDHLKQDIEWYKRTYVYRSFLGTIKQKLFGKNE
jgi:septal ring factor EnvC (AmiA/AmiB activator)